MKLAINLGLILVAIIVVMLGAVYVIAPGQASVSATTPIEKPAPAVFALLATTPENQAVGTGMTQTVTGFTPPSQVEASVLYAANKKAKVLYTIGVAEKGTMVTTTVTESFGMNPFARLQGMKGDQLKPILDAATAALTTEAERLKPHDFTGLSYEVVQVAPKQFLYLEASTNNAAERIRDGYRQAMNLIRTAFQNNNLQPAGQPIAIETDFQEGTTAYNFQFGVPYQGPAPSLLIGVKNGLTPAGTAVKVTYVGNEEGVMDAAYNKIDALLAATRVAESGPYFEVYNDDPTQDGGPRNREIYYIVTGDTQRMMKVAPSAPATAPAAPIASTTVTPAPGAPLPAVEPAPTAAPAATPAPTPAPAPVAPPPGVKVPAGPAPAPN